MGCKAVYFYNNNIRMYSVLEPSGFIIFVPIIEYEFFFIYLDKNKCFKVFIFYKT